MRTVLNWVEITPVLGVALALLFVPGGIVALLLRQRGLRLLALAPALSVSLIVVAALGAPFVGLRWGLLPVGILSLVAASAAWAWSRWAGKPAPAQRWHARLRAGAGIDPVVVVAILLPALVLGWTLARNIGDPEGFAQAYDNFFHLNGVQFVVDTGNASPLWLGNMTSPGELAFYPSGWHALCSLVAEISGATPVVATNAMIMAVGAVIWPLCAVHLVRTMLGRSRTVTMAAGALATGFPAFPYLPLHYGPLYPLFLGLALVPLALSIVWDTLCAAHGRQAQFRLQDRILLLVLVLPGVAVAHPGALLGLIMLASPVLLAVLGSRFFAAQTGLQRMLIVALALAFLLADAALLYFVRPPADQIYWPVIESIPGAIGEVVTAAVYHYPVSWVVALAVAGGAYSVIRGRDLNRWAVLGVALAGSVLYVVVAASTWEPLRQWLTGPWYNNAPRLASLWAIAALPLASLGVSVAVRALLRARWLSGLSRVVYRVPIVAVTLLGVLIAAGAQGAAVAQASAEMSTSYRGSTETQILSSDERRLIERLPDLVPEDAVLAGDPWTGSSFAYALSGRRVLMPHLLMTVTDDMLVLNSLLSTDGDAPEVCAAVQRTGVRYVLDFSADGDFTENDGRFEGLEGLDQSPFVDLVAREGEAKLYRITSCEGTT